MRATALNWYEGLVVAAFEPYAADTDRISVIGFESKFLCVYWKNLRIMRKGNIERQN